MNNVSAVFNVGCGGRSLGVPNEYQRPQPCCLRSMYHYILVNEINRQVNVNYNMFVIFFSSGGGKFGP